MRAARGATVAALAAVAGLAGCRCGGVAPPAPAAPAAPRLVVEVARGEGAERRGLAGVEVQLLEEAALERYLELREAARAPARGPLEAEAAKVEAELARLRAENDRANAVWMQATDAELRARTALALQRGRPAREVGEARRAMVARKRAVWNDAAARAKAVERAERRLAELEAQLSAADPPPPGDPPAPVAAATTGEDGRAVLQPSPGRYAALARVPGAAPGDPPAAWLAWVEVGGAPEQRILLDGRGLLPDWP